MKRSENINLLSRSLSKSLERNLVDVLTTGFIEEREGQNKFYTPMMSSMFLKFDSEFLHLESSLENGEMKVSWTDMPFDTFGVEGEDEFCVSSANEMLDINHFVIGYEALVQSKTDCVMGIGFGLRPNSQIETKKAYIYFDAYHLHGINVLNNREYLGDYEGDGMHTVIRHMD